MKMKTLFNYYGGKFYMLDWLQSLFPDCSKDCFHMVEVFGGSGNVSLNTFFTMNTYNDINEEIFNLFKVCREYPDDLIEKIYFTPVHRCEHNLCSPDDTAVNDIERARRTLVGITLSRNSERHGSFGFVTSGHKRTSLFKNYPQRILSIIARLKNIQFECKPFDYILKTYDNPGVFFYCDPPYLHCTRVCKDAYINEMSIGDHVTFLSMAKASKAKIAISGYDSDLYNTELSEWNRYEKTFVSHSSAAKAERTEVLWTNYEQDNATLFQ